MVRGCRRTPKRDSTRSTSSLRRVAGSSRRTCCGKARISGPSLCRRRGAGSWEPGFGFRARIRNGNCGAVDGEVETLTGSASDVSASEASAWRPLLGSARDPRSRSPIGDNHDWHSASHDYLLESGVGVSPGSEQSMSSLREAQHRGSTHDVDGLKCRSFNRSGRKCLCC
jgi:hypothetical protein